jgi:hypothetical protein
MSKPELIKLSGWMFISGAVAFITILSNSHDTQHSGSILSALLLTVGMSGLREAYGERAGRFGRGLLFGSSSWYPWPLCMVLGT